MEKMDIDFVAFAENMKIERNQGGLSEVHAVALLLHFNYCFYYSNSAIPFLKQTLFPSQAAFRICEWKSL